MKNIQILVTLKAQVETADFMMEDLATCIDVEDVDLDELISEKDEDVLALLEQFKKIDCTLNMLTEDLRSSLCNDGFDCESYSTWVSELCYDLMRLTGLIETFEEAHKVLELYISETIRGYRILTQDGYGTQE